MFPFFTTTANPNGDHNPTASHVPMLDNLLVPIQKGWACIQTHVQPVVQHPSTPWWDIQGLSWQVPTPSCTHTSPESQTMGSPIQNPIEGITTWCQGVQQWVANQTANSPLLVPASSGLSSTHPTVGDPLLATNTGECGSNGGPPSRTACYTTGNAPLDTDLSASVTHYWQQTKRDLTLTTFITSEYLQETNSPLWNMWPLRPESGHPVDHGSSQSHSMGTHASPSLRPDTPIAMASPPISPRSWEQYLVPHPAPPSPSPPSDITPPLVLNQDRSNMPVSMRSIPPPTPVEAILAMNPHGARLATLLNNHKPRTEQWASRNLVEAFVLLNDVECMSLERTDDSINNGSALPPILKTPSDQTEKNSLYEAQLLLKMEGYNQASARHTDFPSPFHPNGGEPIH